MAYKEKKDPLTGKGKRHQRSATKKEKISSEQAWDKHYQKPDIEFRRSDYKLTKPKVKRMVKELDAMLEKAKINANLRFAIEEIKKALTEGNFKLAANLSGVKSYVSGRLDDPGFGEDNDYNNNLFGSSIYSQLDGLAFELSMGLDTIKPGTTIFLAGGGVMEAPKPDVIHPVIKMMQDDQAKIEEEVRKRHEAEALGKDVVVSGPICKEDGLPMEFDHSEDDLKGDIYDVYRCKNGHTEKFLVASTEE